MQLPAAYAFFVIEFSFEFGQKSNNFGVSFYVRIYLHGVLYSNPFF